MEEAVHRLLTGCIDLEKEIVDFNSYFDQVDRELDSSLRQLVNDLITDNNSLSVLTRLDFGESTP